MPLARRGPNSQRWLLSLYRDQPSDWEEPPESGSGQDPPTVLFPGEESAQQGTTRAAGPAMDKARPNAAEERCREDGAAKVHRGHRGTAPSRRCATDPAAAVGGLPRKHHLQDQSANRDLPQPHLERVVGASTAGDQCPPAFCSLSRPTLAPVQSRLTQQFALALKGEKLGGQLSGGALQKRHQLIQRSPGPDGLHQLLRLEA